MFSLVFFSEQTILRCHERWATFCVLTLPRDSFCDSSAMCMRLNTERMCVLDTNKVNLCLGFTHSYFLYPMVSGKALMSDAPSCLLILYDPQRQTEFCCVLLHTQWGGDCCRFGAVQGRPSKEEGVSEPDSGERKNGGTCSWMKMSV